jgi:two-component sensor histidine kinase/FixJ family two-component response regulator
VSGATTGELEIERAPLPDAPVDTTAAGERPTVLLVDDNADIRDYVARLLAQHYDVRTACDGRAALAAMRQDRPDLLLSDVMMPWLDGFGLVREVRADPKLADVPVVLLSARAGEDAGIEGLQAGADDYLVKPFGARELLARVGSNLRMAQLRRGYEQRLASDLRAMTLLRDVGSECARENADTDWCLHRLVDTAIAISGAEKGNLRVFNTEAGALTIAAQRGFEAPFLEFFRYVADEGSACGAAMAGGRRVIVEDVLASPMFRGQPSRDVLIDAGVGAVISVPLTSSRGDVLGMISTHFARPHRPGERELHFLDLLARQAADYLERKQSEQLAQVLFRELQHRSNNLLAVVQAIAHNSLSGDRSLKEATAAFTARLQALARANRELTKSNWTGVSLSEIVRWELEPFAEQTVVQGGRVVLAPQFAQNFSLALHELATNAAKYGAFSARTGKVGVCWSVTNDAGNSTLRFMWQESGGPPVIEPTRRGFGTSLLRAVCADIRFDYAAGGLSCEIEVPLGAIMPDPIMPDPAAALAARNPIVVNPTNPPQ